MRTLILFAMALVLAQPVAARDIPENAVELTPLSAHAPPGLLPEFLESAEDCTEFAELAVQLADLQTFEAYPSCVD